MTVLDELMNARKANASKTVIGAKQVRRAIADNASAVSKVFVATDADVFVTKPVFDACSAADVQVIEVPSMKELGAACGMTVGAAAVLVKR